MKIREMGSLTGYQLNSRSIKVNKNKQSSFYDVNFKGTLPKPSPILDRFLNNKITKSAFKLASLNPFAFNIAALALTCIVMRPLTILITPGSTKEDRRYAAGKSVIASTIANTSRIVFCLPLANAMKKLGKASQAGAVGVKFPKIGTPKFDAFNYLVNNGFAVILSLATSAIIVEAVAKVMDKLVPVTKKTKDANKEEIKPKNKSSEKREVGL